MRFCGGWIDYKFGTDEVIIMEVTIFSVIVLILSLVFILQRRVECFLYAAIFFSGYSGTSVLNVFGFSLQPSFFFVIIYVVLRLIASKRIEYRLSGLLPVFFVYCVISVVFPLFIHDTELMIISQDGVAVPIRLSISNFTQLLYLLFDFVFLNALLRYRRSEQVKNNFIKYFIYGLLSVELICAYQALAFRVGLPFDSLFRQNVHGNIQGDRLYGPCIEASMLCYYLIPAIAVVFRYRKNWFGITLILGAILIGLATQSSTFLVGMALLVLCCIPLVIRFFMVEHSVATWGKAIIGASIVLLAVLLLSEQIGESIEAFIVKLQRLNESGHDRFEAFEHMSAVGIRYPFGIGFGSGRSTDLLSTWLCNIGIVGTALFLLAMSQIAIDGIRRRDIERFIPLALVLVAMFTSVPEPYNLFVWYFIFYAMTGTKHRIATRKEVLYVVEGKVRKSEKRCDGIN